MPTTATNHTNVVHHGPPGPDAHRSHTRIGAVLVQKNPLRPPAYNGPNPGSRPNSRPTTHHTSAAAAPKRLPGNRG